MIKYLPMILTPVGSIQTNGATLQMVSRLNSLRMPPSIFYKPMTTKIPSLFTWRLPLPTIHARPPRIIRNDVQSR